MQLPKGSPNTEGYFQVNYMLKQLSEKRNLLNLYRRIERINWLAGAPRPAVQNALRLATDLHQLWAHQSSK